MTADSTTGQTTRHPRLNRAAAVATRLSTNVIPALPDHAKRLMARPVTIDGNTLDPTLRLLVAGQKLSGLDGLSTGDDVALCRKRLHEWQLAMDRKPVPVGGVEELSIPGPAGPIPARHYRPPADQGGPLLLYFHGGGFVLGDLDGFDRLCRLICVGARIHVVSVDYRLAPEHPAPAGLDDAYAAFRWALDHGDELGIEPGVVAVSGDSAGGTLAAAVTRLGRDDGAPPSMQMLIYPITDLRGGTRSRQLFGSGFLLTQRDMDWFNHHYLGGSGIDETDPRVSPLLADDLSGMPRALVITAGFDPLRDEGDAYAAAMHDAGVTVDLRRMASLTHGFANMTTLGGGSAIGLAEIISALRAHLCYR